MELRHIRYFIAVAEELHFGVAAKKVGIAQPALSQQIRQLEQELGGALFIRSKRSVSLTEAGKVFLSEARQLIAKSKHAVELTRRAFSGMVGKLTVGFVASATWDILPPILSVFSKAYPDVEINLLHLHTHQQIKALHQGDIDIGMIELQVDDPSLYFYGLKKEICCVALPQGHHLLSKPEISIKDLKNERFVAVNRDAEAAYYDTVVKLCMDAGFSPIIAQTANEMQTLLSLVSCGIGITLTHESSKNYRHDLTYKPLCDVNLCAYHLSLAWGKKDVSPITACFLDIARRLCPEVR